MNRKKILVCLNGSDNAQMESDFIERMLEHPHNLIVRFHMDSIEAQEALELQSMLMGNANGHSGNYTKGLSNQGDIHAYGAISNSKRQIIHSNSVKELLTECQFADLLIIRKSNFEASCTHYGQKKKMRDILKKSGCPVLMVPDHVCEIEQILLIYDGSPVALSAIKVLRMTMNSICCELPVTVLIPSLDDNLFTSNEEKMLIEYLRLHFKDLGIHKVCEESAHTLHFAIDPGKNLLMVVNDPNQILPAFLEDELSVFYQNSSNSFQFLVSSYR